MVASTNDLGKVAVVLPLGALSRKGSEAEIRRGLIEDDLVETVIALAENLFYGAFIPASILVLSRSKVPARRGHVLFIDAQDLVETRRSMNRLSATDVTEILRVDARYSAVAGRSAVVPLQDVRSNHFDLTPFAYVEGEKRLPTEGTAWPAIAAMSAAERLRDEAMTRLHAQIEGLGLD